MSVNLQKGQKISLTKAGSGGLKKVMVGLGWDEAQPQSKGFFGLFSAKPADIDCDASAILCGSDGKLVSPSTEASVVYFNNRKHSSGAVIHHGDNLTGGGDGDDEEITVDLTLLPGNVDKIVFVVNIYDANVRHQDFGMIRNAFIRIVDTNANKEICRYDLSENYSGQTGLIVGEIYRHEGEWKFNAIGQGVASASRLESLIKLYR